MQSTRRAFLSFIVALAATTPLPADAQTAEDANPWAAIDLFSKQCLALTPSPHEMMEIAEGLHWTPLSSADTTALTPPMGVIPGFHRAWRLGVYPSEMVVEVGGSGAWSFASQDEARSRGERLVGPMPNVAEGGADGRFGFSNHWICVVHFRGGDPDAITARIVEESVRSGELGAPLTTLDSLDNRPGWSSVDWFVRSERSVVSFTYTREADVEFSRELRLGYFTSFEGEPE